MNRQNDHQNKERRHHDLGDTFHAVLDTEKADHETDHADQNCPECFRAHISKRVAENAGYGIRIHPLKGSADVKPAVFHHPSGDGGVIHHEHIAADDADPLQPVPSGTGRLNGLKGTGCAFL